jgi:hypothetical protein
VIEEQRREGSDLGSSFVIGVLGLAILCVVLFCSCCVGECLAFPSDA